MRPWYEQQEGDDLSVSEFWQLCASRDTYRQEYAKYWQHMDGQTISGRRVDGVIQPVAATLAGQQNDFQYYAYSAIANVLDAPAAVFPVSSGFSVAELTGEETRSVAASNEEDHKVQNNCKYCCRPRISST